MKKLQNIASFILILILLTGCQKAMEEDPKVTNDLYKKAKVIEIVTFNLADNVTYDEFAKLDRAVQEQHVSKQPGFVARHAGQGEKGEWVVVVYWRSAEDAAASMSSFMQAPTASEFVNSLQAETMTMKRFNMF